MRRLLLAFLPLALTMLFAQAASAAGGSATWTGPCLDGTKSPTCHFWKAKVDYVSDGDTVYVTIGRAHHQSVRWIGINAMELSVHSNIRSRRRGDCHAIEATNLIEKYIHHGSTVRLAAQDPRSTTGGRLHRSVAFFRHGAWHDLGEIEMQQGLALWLPNAVEWAHNLQYHTLAEQAVAAQRGLYNPTACGFGPNQEAQLKLDVNWDADGSDSANLNGEWVDIRNTGSTDVPLGGWWLRDSFLRYNPNGRPGFEFPAGTVVPAGGTVRLHMGCGSADSSVFYWCQSGPVFENVTYDRTHMGDGGYLFDPQGDLRSSMMYPCVVSCSDPLQGKVRVDAHPSAPESVSVTNVSAGPINLEGYLLKIHHPTNPGVFMLGYPIGANSWLNPGETLRIYLGESGSDSRLTKFWGLSNDYVLRDAGPGAVSLRTDTDISLDCHQWGGGWC